MKIEQKLLMLLAASAWSVAATAPAGVAISHAKVKGTAPSHFATVLPNKPLPSDAQCATWVQANPIAESRPSNALYNLTRGKTLKLPFFYGSDARANSQIATRVSGNFVGTTEEIIRWGACKWGIDENVVKAVAVQDSDWQQAHRAGETHLAEAINAAALYGNPVPPFQSAECSHNTMPGATLTPVALTANNSGISPSCSRDWGVLQVNYEQHPSTWPQAEASTAMNVDVALSVVRACYQGYEKWLSTKTVDAGMKAYAKGDLMGCVGRYKSGLWHDAAAERYIAQINTQLFDKVWTHPDFQNKAWVYP
jgi:hypothetical protein